MKLVTKVDKFVIIFMGVINSALNSMKMILLVIIKDYFFNECITYILDIAYFRRTSNGKLFKRDFHLVNPVLDRVSVSVSE